MYQEDNREFPSESRRKFTKLMCSLKNSWKISPILQFTTEKIFLSVKISLCYMTLGCMRLYMLHSSSHILWDAASTHYWWITTFKKIKIKNACGQWKLINKAIPSKYEMTGWYKNIYLGPIILCISKVSSKKAWNIHNTKKDTERTLINLRITMKKTLHNTFSFKSSKKPKTILKKHSKTKTGFFIKAS